MGHGGRKRGTARKPQKPLSLSPSQAEALGRIGAAAEGEGGQAKGPAKPRPTGPPAPPRLRPSPDPSRLPPQCGCTARALRLVCVGRGQRPHGTAGEHPPRPARHAPRALASLPRRPLSAADALEIARAKAAQVQQQKDFSWQTGQAPQGDRGGGAQTTAQASPAAPSFV